MFQLKIKQMATLNQFKNFTSGLPQTALMPVLFMGHGSPMNGIEINEFSSKWEEIAKQIPVPQAVLVVSRISNVAEVEIPYHN